MLRSPNWLENWLARHQHPISFWLHMLGIPATIAGVVIAIVNAIENDWDRLWIAGWLFVGGYAVQWLGHLIEGNDMGEVIVVKRLLNRPYVAVSPRYER